MELGFSVYGFLVLSLLLFAGVVASKTSGRLGVPALVLFLLLGLCFGPKGLGFIELTTFDGLKQFGLLSLSIILFSGGLDTRLTQVRPILWRSISLATVGVLITALVTALAAYLLLPLTFAQSFLLGAIVSSTDAAAVFSVLRSRSIGLKHRLKPLLEFESGSNDPMALVLTLAALGWALGEQLSGWRLTLELIGQLAIGGGLGIAIGWIGLRFVNRIKLGYEGLYSVLVLALALFSYSITEVAQGNGLLAVYCTGIMLGNQPFMHKQSILKFFDGLAWIMQIGIFVSLGLLIDPIRLGSFLWPGLLMALSVLLLARTAGVFGALLPFRGISLREKTFISWVGLKGAAPLVFALYPILAINQGMPPEVANSILNIVLYIVVISVLVQGTTLSYVAGGLGLDIPMRERTNYPLQIEERRNFQSLMQEIVLPPESRVCGKALYELDLPEESLFVLISRGGNFIMPNGSTRLYSGDKILVLATTALDMERVFERLDVELPLCT